VKKLGFEPSSLTSQPCAFFHTTLTRCPNPNSLPSWPVGISTHPLVSKKLDVSGCTSPSTRGYQGFRNQLAWNFLEWAPGASAGRVWVGRSSGCAPEVHIHLFIFLMVTFKENYSCCPMHTDREPGAQGSSRQALPDTQG
jgi:hypothetical protein